MAWIVVSSKALVTKGEVEVLMLMALVYVVMFSLDINHVFVEE